MNHGAIYQDIVSIFASLLFFLLHPSCVCVCARVVVLLLWFWLQYQLIQSHVTSCSTGRRFQVWNRPLPASSELLPPTCRTDPGSDFGAFDRFRLQMTDMFVRTRADGWALVVGLQDLLPEGGRGGVKGQVDSCQHTCSRSAHGEL